MNSNNNMRQVNISEMESPIPTYQNNLETQNSQISHNNLSQNSKRYNNSSIIINPTSSKSITKRAVKDLIDEIYESKIQYDKKCFDLKMPKETLEQHMYTFLNTKYGLKVKAKLFLIN